MRRYARYIAFILVICGVADGAFVYSQYRQDREFTGTVDPRIVTGSNRIAFMLLGQLAEERSGNIVISPSGIYTSLCMLASGSAGETKDQLLLQLGVDSVTPNELAKANGKLRDSIEHPGSQVNMVITNHMWIDKKYELRDVFVSDCKTDYSVDVSTTDMSGPDAASEMNAWASKASQGAIAETATASDLVHVKSALLSEARFRGKWKYPFDEAKTQPTAFTQSSGKRIDVPMMHTGLRCNYYALQGMQVVAIPYAGDRMYMYVLLPSQRVDLKTLITGFTLDEWNEVLGKMAPRNVELSMPRFTATCNFDTKRALTNIGITGIYGANSDLSGVAPKGLSLSQSKQGAEVVVDERGILDTAVNTPVVPGKAPLASDIHMVADHPFMFIIVDSRTGALLFEGVVNAL